MRKILIIVIIVLLLVFGYNSLVNGIQIGSFQITSIKQLDENNKNLDKKTEEVNSLIDVEYPKRMSELKDASKKMQEIKEQYLNETNLSSDAEIQNALQVESYDIERLWAKVGNHAKEEGVNLKLTLTNGSSVDSNTEEKSIIKDLSFTVDGSYIGITNFVYAMEDDTELNFRIYDFKLVPYQNDILRGTFTVKNVRITKKSLNESLSSSIQEDTTNNTTTDTTNTNTTTDNSVSNTTTNTIAE